MIRARAVIRNGFYSVEFRGHGDESVCAGASMILQAAALGLRDLAKQKPSQIVFEHDVDFQNWNKLDSKDRRKR